MTHPNLPEGVRLGVSPLSWTNEVLDELGGSIPLETCLAEASGNGFAGVELGRKFPSGASAIRKCLEAYGLDLITGWYSGFLAERDVVAEMRAVDAHARLLSACGAGIMVYGPVGRMAPGAPLELPMSRRLVLDPQDIDAYAARLAEFEKRLAGDYGLTLAYHHHLMMVVETFDEICRLMDRAQCGLLLDTGHAFAAGFDYAGLIARFGHLIRHIHLKDVRADRLARVRSEDLSFNAAVRMGMFTVPGDGDVNFVPIVNFVKSSGYQGWMVVEAEQDPSLPEAAPAPATRRAFEFITNLFGTTP